MLSKARTKLIIALTLAFMVVFCVPYVFGVYAGETEVTGEIQRFYVDSTGTVELIGYFDNTNNTSTSMLLTTDADLNTMNNDNIMDIIMYIDQPYLGNNGTFYMHFPLNEKFSESSYVLRMNGGTLLTQTGTLREIPSGINNVSNNALRVGNDIYDVGCMQYTPENISKSIERGGNKVYYKIGDNWFNVLDENAVSTSYFTKDNAIPEAEWDTWEIDTYYHF